MVASNNTRMQWLNEMAWNLLLEREVNHVGSRNETTCMNFHYGRDCLFLHNGSTMIVIWKRWLFLYFVFSHDYVCMCGAKSKMMRRISGMTILIR